MKIKRIYLEIFLQLLIFYSIGMHFVEMEFTHTERSVGAFLWSERVVATLFTIEYFVRWIASRRLLYPLGLAAIVDLIAILPFYIGFLVDLRSLRLIRTLRVLRLFKLYRHSNAVQNIRNAFHRVRYEFSITGFAVLTLAWFSAVAIFELEHTRQPEAFGKLSDALWFVAATLTTVGYGDKVPVTAGGKVVAVCTMILGLGLFGTFVSLIGGAFVEELRRNVGRGYEGTTAVKNNPPLPRAELQATSPSAFDPGQVLKMIDDGLLDDGVPAVHLKTVRLLASACQVILRHEGQLHHAS